MKFVLLIEEDGYELRYWDEINEEIRDTIVSGWDINEFYKKCVDIDFNITKKTLNRAVQILEQGEEDFVIFAAHTKPNHLDTLHEDYFEIEE